MANVGRVNGGMTHNPWHLVVELHGANVVKMAMQGEEAASVGRLDVCNL